VYTASCLGLIESSAPAATATTELQWAANEENITTTKRARLSKDCENNLWGHKVTEHGTVK